MANDTPMHYALELVTAGVLRVDTDAGQVYKTVTHPLYTFERPVGDLNASGYVKVSLPDRRGVSGRGSRSVYGHRLVWAVAHEMPAPSLVINHRNGVKHDNRLANLELVDVARNNQHAYDYGLTPSGEKHGNACITDEAAREVRRLLAEGWTYERLAARFGVSTTTVGRIRSGSLRFARI